MLSVEDFKKAKEGFVPLTLRDVPLQTSTVEWTDIGGTWPLLVVYLKDTNACNLLCVGLAETRRILRETLEWPTKYAPIFKQSPLRLRSGSVSLSSKLVETNMIG